MLYSSVLKSLSIKASKICNDLRLLSSGPRAGFHEINLPAMQPGSSIMPGKVNPVIPEVVNQVCFRVIGSDLTVTLAAEAGQLQLNVMEPVIAACLLEGQRFCGMRRGRLRKHCVTGITANEDVCRMLLERSIGTVTALNPVIGYDKATELAAEALRTGKGIVELVREKGILTEEQLARILDPAAMTGTRQPPEDSEMIWVDLIVVLACIVWGARLGGIGLGTVAALGMSSLRVRLWTGARKLPRRGAAHRSLRSYSGGGAAGGGGTGPDGLGCREGAAASSPADYVARSAHLLSVHVRLRHRARVLLAAADHRRGFQKGEGTAGAAALDLGDCLAGGSHGQSDVRRHRRHGGALLKERHLWTDRCPV